MRGQDHKNYIPRNIPIIYIITCNQFKSILTKLSRRYVGKKKILITSEHWYSHWTKERAFYNAENDIIKKEVGNMGMIYLDKPDVFNAVNWSMIVLIHKILQEWETCKTHVVWKSGVEKVFSSGGDLKSIYFSQGSDPDLRPLIETTRGFHKLSYCIGTYKKPIVSILDGISFGGVTGMAVNGKFSVATENTVYATPENSIGLIPNDGNLHKLSKLKKHLGLYLGLTGHKLKGCDVWLTGIATHFIPSNQIDSLTKELTKSDGSDINEILKKYHVKNLPDKLSLEPYMEKINHCFSVPTVEEIIDRLKNDNSDWSNKTMKVLSRCSPTSLKVTKRAFDLASQKSFKECLKMEFALTYAVVHNDFREGVRARVVEKDDKPNWQPKALSDVTDEYINKLFSFAPKHDQLKL